MERSKLLHLLAFDLRWFSPDPAKRVIQRAVQAGLLREEGDKVHLAFEADAVDIPLNYRPPDNLADAEGPVDLPSRKLAALAKPPQAPAPGATPAPAHAEAAAERARRGNLVTEDVAALLVARRAGEDVRERARALDARLTSGGPPRA